MFGLGFFAGVGIWFEALRDKGGPAVFVHLAGPIRELESTGVRFEMRGHRLEPLVWSGVSDVYLTHLMVEGTSWYRSPAL